MQSIPTNRYKLHKSEDNTAAIIDTHTGQYVLSDESMTVCENVLMALQGRAGSGTEAIDVARNIANRAEPLPYKRAYWGDQSDRGCHSRDATVASVTRVFESVRLDDIPDWGPVRGRVTVYVGLWNTGNQLASFSVTVDGSEGFGGCCHGVAAGLWPALQPIIDLHLSDQHGAPMHAEGNGWYWLAGALGGLGQQYTGLQNDPKYGPIRTEDDCYRLFAKHVRLPEADVRGMVDSWWAEAQRMYKRPPVPTGPLGPHIEIAKQAYTTAQVAALRDALRAVWVRECEAMRPRWRAEADAGLAMIREWEREAAASK